METWGTILIFLGTIGTMWGILKLPVTDSGKWVMLILLGVIFMILGISMSDTVHYSKKVIRHEYTIGYTYTMNNQNQIVTKDTLLMWK